MDVTSLLPVLGVIVLGAGAALLGSKLGNSLGGDQRKPEPVRVPVRKDERRRR